MSVFTKKVEYPFIPSDSVFLMRSVITSDFQQNSIKPPQIASSIALAGIAPCMLNNYCFLWLHMTVTN